jgi:prolyl 4-hydroxylase
MDCTFQELGGEIIQVANLLQPEVCAHLVQVAECYEFKSPPSGASLQGELRSHEVLPFANADPLLISTSQLLMGNLKTVREWMARRYGVPFSYAELYSLDRYYPGQSHKRHFDGLILTDRYAELAKNIPARDVSIIIFLNDTFTGGDLVFDRQSIKVKPAIGSAILFPACYTHAYQTLPVLQGCKYTVTAWLLH